MTVQDRPSPAATEGGQFSLVRTLRDSRPLLLLGALMLHLLLAPHVPSPLLRLAIQVGIILAAASLGIDTPRHRRWVVGLAVPAVVCTVAGALTGSRIVDWCAILLALGLYLFVISLMLQRIFRAPVVSLDEIGLALCTYVLLGLVWVLFYLPVVAANPAAFVFNVAPAADEIGYTMAYFSYVTLTTLGYGDIVPVSPLARGLAVVEALTGVLFLAVLISRLVGSFRKARN